MEQDQPPKSEVMLLDIMFYESPQAAGIPIVYQIFRLLDRGNPELMRLVKVYKDTQLIPKNHSLRASAHDAGLPSHPVYKKSLEAGVPRDQRYLLDTDSFEVIHGIPSTYDKLRKAHDCFQKNGRELGMFILNSLGSNGDLSKVVQELDTEFPLLSTCPWIAYETLRNPLVGDVRMRVRDHGKIIGYNPDTRDDGIEAIALDGFKRTLRYFRQRQNA